MSSPAATGDEPLSPKSFSYTKVQLQPLLPVTNTRIIDAGRAPVEHKHLFPKAYKVIWPIFFTFMMFGRAIGLFVLSYIVLCWWLNLTILIPAALSIYLAYSGYQNMVRNIASREVGHEFNATRPVIRDAPEFKDSALIWRLWSASPYRAALLTHAQQSGLVDADAARGALAAARSAATAGEAPDPDSVDRRIAPLGPWDRVEECTFYQPVEGYCAPATVNTLLYSISRAAIVPTRRMPGPATLKQLHEAVARSVGLLPAGVSLKSVESVPVDGATVNFDAFCALIAKANRPNVRVAANFLRQPLFGTAPTSAWGRARALIGGHWSPIIATLDTPAVALVSDVNADYGPFVVTLRRLYDACRTKDGDKFRGLVIAEFEGDFDGHN